MYKLGHALCTNCFRADTAFLYSIPSIDEEIAFRVFKNKTGHFKVFAVKRNETDIEQLKRNEVQILEKPVTENGMPVKIRISYEGREYSLTSMDRICSHCFEEGRINYLPLYTGFTDTYVITVVGEVATGKTAFVESLKNSRNLSQWELEKGVHIQFSSQSAGIGELAATRVNDLNIIDQILITKNGKKKANIILCDSPGELFSNKGVRRIQASEIHRMRIEHSDAVINMINMDNEEEIRRAEEDKDHKFLCALAADIAEKPMAIVLTKMDLLKSRMVTKSEGIVKDGHVLINGAYDGFVRQASYDKNENKAMKQMIDRHLIHTLLPGLQMSFCGMHDEKKTGYFIISSGTPAAAENQLNYEHAVNIYYPLEYLLIAIGAM